MNRVKISFVVKLDISVGSFNALYELSNKACVPNKTEDLNLSVFNMTAEINESKTLTKHILCECKCKFEGRKCSSDQGWNNNKYRCKCKKSHVWGKDYVWNPVAYSCKNEKYLPSIMDDSAIPSDEGIQPYDEDGEAKSYDKTRIIPTNSNRISIFY